jgi:peptidoglycan hydrolase CwlO-like protein
MKKFSLVVLLLFVSFVFSFDIIHAQVQTDSADKLVEIKEIRQSIKHHLKNIKKLEGEIEKKSEQIEKVLVKLPENSLVSQQVVDQELNPKLEGIMTHLMQIGEYETAS